MKINDGMVTMMIMITTQRFKLVCDLGMDSGQYGARAVPHSVPPLCAVQCVQCAVQCVQCVPPCTLR